MAEDYFGNLDRYLAPQEENRFLSGSTKGSAGGPNLSDPIAPVSKLGVTVVEKPGGGQANILQSITSNIRQGVGLMQLMIQTDLNAPMGGGVASVGKDQRQAIKELLKVSGVKMQGLELPTSTSNLNGFDGQRGFDEKKRKQDIQHIKNVINFSAEVGFGGGVDNWSQEFQRNIFDASFHEKDKTGFKDFEGYDENRDTVKTLVDKETGQIMQFSAMQVPTISVPEWERDADGDYVDVEGKKLEANIDNPNFLLERVPVWNDETNDFNSRQMTWTEFKDYAQKRNEEEIADKSKWLSPEEWFQRQQLETQFIQQKGQSLQFSGQYKKQADEVKELLVAKEEYAKMEAGKSEEELQTLGLMVQVSPTSHGGSLLPAKFQRKSEMIQDSINSSKQSLKFSRETSANADAQAQATLRNMNNITTVEKFAVDKTTKSYAELGMHALDQTKVYNPDSPIHVGPELGWPSGYGGHPVEFVNLIKKSREEMVKMLQSQKQYADEDPTKLMGIAKKHISGMLDTSHLSMWYNHFPKEGNESEDKRLKRFNKWYMDQMDYLAKEDVVGAVQIVDSMTGDHRHLPVGQGVFPTVDAVKLLQEKGFKGDIIAEGHEEDPLETGRNQYALWSAFGASMGTGSGYFGGSGGGNAFGNIYSGVGGGAAGYRAPPNYIIGGYSPSNDWKLWSETPLE